MHFVLTNYTINLTNEFSVFSTAIILSTVLVQMHATFIETLACATSNTNAYSRKGKIV